jgi:predicted permease
VKDPDRVAADGVMTMAGIRRFVLRLINLVRPSRADRHLSKEIAAHLALIEEDFLRRGMTPDEARLAARRAFGSTEQAKELQREAGSFAWVDDLKRDLAYAARTLRRTPAFTAAAIVTIALGLGANLAIFSLVNAVLLKTVPARNPGELLFLSVASASGQSRTSAPPYPCIENFRAGSRSFSAMAAFSFEAMTLTIDGQPEKVLGQVASGSYFDVLGIKPALGRTLVPADEREPSVAVLSHEYWQRRFGGAADVLGRQIAYKHRLLTVVGVTQKGFTGLEPGFTIHVTVPITIRGPEFLSDQDRWWLKGVGRLAPGYSREQALAEIDPLFQTFMKDTGQSVNERFARMDLIPAGRGLPSLREEFAEPLVLLMGITALVLLIACVNVANLLLARAAARRHEFATRVAIGASRGRLVRQLLTESVVLTACGAAAGVVLASWLVTSLTAPLAAGPYPMRLDLQPDYRVAIFSGALCILTTILFGLAPALRAGRTHASADLRHGRAVLSPPGRRLMSFNRSAFVVVQIALTLVLTVAMSLLIGTLASLRVMDAGFRARDVPVFDVEFLDSAGSAEQLADRWARLIARVQQMPGVESASLSWLTPLSGRHRGVAMGPPGREPRPVALNHASPAYFETMGIPLHSGRAFTPRDDRAAPPVVILNETAARFYFGARNPVAQRMVIVGTDREIVGVAADVKHQSLRDEIPHFAYVPVQQPVDRLTELLLAVRGRPDVNALGEAIRREVRNAGSGVLVGPATTLQEHLDRSLLRERLMSTLSGIFGLLGLALAAVGLFGVMSFRVLGRLREIAVRMALGSSAAAVRWRVLRESLAIAVTGVAVGVPLSLMAARALTGLLFGLSPTNPVVVAGCSIVLIAVAVGAAYLPARRASRVDPMTVLRAE